MGALQSMMMGSLKDLPSSLWRSDVLFALALSGILVVLILPLHALLLDFALASSLAFSVVILMTVLFLKTPLELSVFPTILLVVTMLRLALNVASTRLILSKGHQGTFAAGQVIKAFGSFIMGGNFLIGLVIFIILVVINFVVITKGSGRIAEVVARFSLDALPGKQMAVDADLSSGLIDQEEARKRRGQIQDEINFYGAMDGAAKFVRGDAVAGIFITALNLLGGLLVGMFQQGLTIGRAFQTYAFLTVGDGLVAQVPALIVSVAAGMLISKTSSRGKADEVFQMQLGAYPRALGMSAGLMAALALLPGVPAIPFLLMAALGMSGVVVVGRRQDLHATHAANKPRMEKKEQTAAEEKKPADMLRMDYLTLELGVGLVSLIKNEEDLAQQIKRMREKIAQQFGVLMPTMRLVDNLALETYSYCLKIKEIKSAEGRIYTNKWMALDPSGQLDPLKGEEGVEPILKIKGRWINEQTCQAAKEMGYVVADGKHLMLTHIAETLKKYLPDMLTFGLLQQLIQELPKAHQKLYADLVPMQMPAAVVQRVLKNLLAERVSVRDLPVIIEALAEYADQTKDPLILTGLVRQHLSRQICATFSFADGILKVVSLTPTWIQVFEDAQKENVLSMAPSRLQEFLQQVERTYRQSDMQITSLAMTPPALLVPNNIRNLVYQALVGHPLNIPVLGEAEVYPGYRLDVLKEL